jgi:type II secretory pathway pseudopilin PulG
MVRRVCNDRAAGFLLIEVAVALIIVALAFGYGFRSLSGGLERLGRDHNTAAALLLAQSTMDRVGYDIVLDQGEATGSTKDGFTWSVQTAPYATPASPPPDIAAGYVVRVTVAWKERLTNRQIMLSTVRLAYRGQA